VSSTTAEASTGAVNNETGHILISSDSHVMEDPQFWKNEVPAALTERAPGFPPARKTGLHMADHRPGGYDAEARISEMEIDGVSAEVLYPTLGLKLFSLSDQAVQEACFVAYNDWLIDYCKAAPNRLFGVACIATFDIDHAVAEMRRTNAAGLHGALIWQVPHPDLPFTSDHYDPLWAAAQELDVAINVHILTGFDYSSLKLEHARLDPIEAHRGSVNLKLHSATNTLFDIIFSGVLERFPRLKFIVVESEIGWIPFVLQQWDYYYRRFEGQRIVPMTMLPSQYFYRQVYATFFNDPIGGQLLSTWGQDNCMWSSDYPHPNSTWPRSRQVLTENLGHLPDAVVGKLVNGNVRKLYPFTV
jgi:predicted TIM-barrel fold metal-dependent hydrolase